MKALSFEKSGVDNLKVADVQKPDVGTHDVRIRVKMAGVNPIDYFVVNALPVKPMPHIAGAEIYGEVEAVGEHVRNIKSGDRVVVYNRVFDGTCDMCLSSREMLCRNGGIMSVVTNGGYAEYFVAPDKNVFKVPDYMSDELAVSMPVSALTAYHALKSAGVRANENVVVFGASGNTGQFAVQFAKRMGATVVAVSRKGWLKDFGADYLMGYENVKEEVSRVTKGKMGDVVVNSIGSSVWDSSLQVLGVAGRIVFFGGITGSNVSLDLSRVYSNYTRIIGTTGGSRLDLMEILNSCDKCKVKVWRTYPLEQGQEALKMLFDPSRDGRILIKVN
ncbi:alcohol dehydrogenase catalytic domain-containing protein [Sulfuracidifex tepidarius]|uniref:Acryloyl-coenzyme A reductase n=1 Tax=Sulfuracidifex tepidarius TaxID=1294262 RepID=A0A510DY99_9CREN|nr:alcohol dehydrogenase catalytic domain-containing protein [Sulfuracidifex tepidarius]BBG25204.1 Acryloyl-coenzyme A reductase [Sulfuracidifex tepidarius]BBG27997.1 Acryloyl-coenzyme A reductase [Sulfuracidifex tepidarius]